MVGVSNRISWIDEKNYYSDSLDYSEIYQYASDKLILNELCRNKSNLLYKGKRAKTDLSVNLFIMTALKARKRGQKRKVMYWNCENKQHFRASL